MGICKVKGRRHRVSPCRSAYFASPWWLLTLALRRRSRKAALLFPESWWHLTMRGSRPSLFMIIPNTKRHPNNMKTDQLPISEVITGLPRPYHNITLTPTNARKKNPVKLLVVFWYCSEEQPRQIWFHYSKKQGAKVIFHKGSFSLGFPKSSIRCSRNSAGVCYNSLVWLAEKNECQGRLRLVDTIM